MIPPPPPPPPGGNPPSMSTAPPPPPPPPPPPASLVSPGSGFSLDAFPSPPRLSNPSPPPPAIASLQTIVPAPPPVAPAEPEASIESKAEKETVVVSVEVVESISSISSAITEVIVEAPITASAPVAPAESVEPTDHLVEDPISAGTVSALDDISTRLLDTPLPEIIDSTFTADFEMGFGKLSTNVEHIELSTIKQFAVLAPKVEILVVSINDDISTASGFINTFKDAIDLSVTGATLDNLSDVESLVSNLKDELKIITEIQSLEIVPFSSSFDPNYDILRSKLSDIRIARDSLKASIQNYDKSKESFDALNRDLTKLLAQLSEAESVYETDVAPLVESFSKTVSSVMAATARYNTLAEQVSGNRALYEKCVAGISVAKSVVTESERSASVSRMETMLNSPGILLSKADELPETEANVLPVEELNFDSETTTFVSELSKAAIAVQIATASVAGMDEAGRRPYVPLIPVLSTEKVQRLLQVTPAEPLTQGLSCGPDDLRCVPAARRLAQEAAKALQNIRVSLTLASSSSRSSSRAHSSAELKETSAQVEVELAPAGAGVRWASVHAENAYAALAAASDAHSEISSFSDRLNEIEGKVKVASREIFEELSSFRARFDVLGACLGIQECVPFAIAAEKKRLQIENPKDSQEKPKDEEEQKKKVTEGEKKVTKWSRPQTASKASPVPTEKKREDEEDTIRASFLLESSTRFEELEKLTKDIEMSLHIDSSSEESASSSHKHLVGPFVPVPAGMKALPSNYEDLGPSVTEKEREKETKSWTSKSTSSTKVGSSNPSSSSPAQNPVSSLLSVVESLISSISGNSNSTNNEAESQRENGLNVVSLPHLQQLQQHCVVLRQELHDYHLNALNRAAAALPLLQQLQNAVAELNVPLGSTNVRADAGLLTPLARLVHALCVVCSLGDAETSAGELRDALAASRISLVLQATAEAAPQLLKSLAKAASALALLRQAVADAHSQEQEERARCVVTLRRSLRPALQSLLQAISQRATAQRSLFKSAADVVSRISEAFGVKITHYQSISDAASGAADLKNIPNFSANSDTNADNTLSLSLVAAARAVVASVPALSSLSIYLEDLRRSIIITRGSAFPPVGLAVFQLLESLSSVIKRHDLALREAFGALDGQKVRAWQSVASFVHACMKLLDSSESEDSRFSQIIRASMAFLAQQVIATIMDYRVAVSQGENAPNLTALASKPIVRDGFLTIDVLASISSSGTNHNVNLKAEELPTAGEDPSVLLAPSTLRAHALELRSIREALDEARKLIVASPNSSGAHGATPAPNDTILVLLEELHSLKSVVAAQLGEGSAERARAALLAADLAAASLRQDDAASQLRRVELRLQQEQERAAAAAATAAQASEAAAALHRQERARLEDALAERMREADAHVRTQRQLAARVSQLESSESELQLRLREMEQQLLAERARADAAEKRHLTLSAEFAEFQAVKTKEATNLREAVERAQTMHADTLESFLRRQAAQEASHQDSLAAVRLQAQQQSELELQRLLQVRDSLAASERAAAAEKADTLRLELEATQEQLLRTKEKLAESEGMNASLRGELSVATLRITQQLEIEQKLQQKQVEALDRAAVDLQLLRDRAQTLSEMEKLLKQERRRVIFLESQLGVPVSSPVIILPSTTNTTSNSATATTTVDNPSIKETESISSINKYNSAMKMASTTGSGSPPHSKSFHRDLLKNRATEISLVRSVPSPSAANGSNSTDLLPLTFSTPSHFTLGTGTASSHVSLTFDHDDADLVARSSVSFAASNPDISSLRATLFAPGADVSGSKNANDSVSARGNSVSVSDLASSSHINIDRLTERPLPSYPTVVDPATRNDEKPTVSTLFETPNPKSRASSASSRLSPDSTAVTRTSPLASSALKTPSTVGMKRTMSIRSQAPKSGGNSYELSRRDVENVPVSAKAVEVFGGRHPLAQRILSVSFTAAPQDPQNSKDLMQLVRTATAAALLASREAKQCRDTREARALREAELLLMDYSAARMRQLDIVTTATPASSSSKGIDTLQDEDEELSIEESALRLRERDKRLLSEAGDLACSVALKNISGSRFILHEFLGKCALQRIQHRQTKFTDFQFSFAPTTTPNNQSSQDLPVTNSADTEKSIRKKPSFKVDNGVVIKDGVIISAISTDASFSNVGVSAKKDANGVEENLKGYSLDVKRKKKYNSGYSHQNNNARSLAASVALFEQIVGPASSVNVISKSREAPSESLPRLKSIGSGINITISSEATPAAAGSTEAQPPKAPLLRVLLNGSPVSLDPASVLKLMNDPNFHAEALMPGSAVGSGARKDEIKLSFTAKNRAQSLHELKSSRKVPIGDIASASISRRSYNESVHSVDLEDVDHSKDLEGAQESHDTLYDNDSSSDESEELLGEVPQSHLVTTTSALNFADVDINLNVPSSAKTSSLSASASPALVLSDAHRESLVNVLDRVLSNVTDDSDASSLTMEVLQREVLTLTPVAILGQQALIE